MSTFLIRIADSLISCQKDRTTLSTLWKETQKPHQESLFSVRAHPLDPEETRCCRDWAVQSPHGWDTGMGRAGAWQPELWGALKRLRNYPLPGKKGFGIGPTGCRSWVKKLENLSFSANLDHFKGTSPFSPEGSFCRKWIPHQWTQLTRKHYFPWGCCLQRGGRKAGDLLHIELHLMPAYQVQNWAQQSCEKCQALKYWHQVLDSSDKTRTILKSAARLGSPRKATSSPHKACTHTMRPRWDCLEFF